MILPTLPYRPLTGSESSPLDPINSRSILFGAAGDSARRLNSQGLFNVGTTDIFTMEAWVRPVSFFINQAIMGRFLFVGSQLQVFFNVSAAGHLRFEWTPNGSTVDFISLSGGNTLALNTWQHVAVAFDTTSARLFINGLPIEGDHPTGNAVFSTPTSDWTIGSSGSLGIAVWSDKIFAPRVWQTKRSDAEILDNYLKRIATDPDLHASWPDGLIDTHATFDVTLEGAAVLDTELPPAF